MLLKGDHFETFSNQYNIDESQLVINNMYKQM